MRRRWEQLRGHRLDLALVITALALVFVVVWDRGRVSTSEAEARRHELFDAWRPDQVTSIAFEAGATQLTLRAEPDDLEGRTWSLTVNDQPVPVDDQAVASLLVVFEYAAFEREVEGLSDAELGLDSPRATLAVEMPPLAYRLRMGKEAPGGGAYVAVEGGARGFVRYVISGETAERLLLDPTELRSRRLAPYLSVSVAGFDVAHDDTRFSIDRGGWGGRTAGAFLVKTDRDEVRADHRVLDGWFAALGDLQAQSFLELPASDPPDAAVITFRPDEKGAPVGKLVIAGECPQAGQVRVVRRGVDPVAACAPKDVVERLLIDPALLYDRHVIGTAESDIAELRLAAGPVVVDVARKEEGWHMRLPAEGTADAEAMEGLLDELVTAAGERLSRSEASDLEALGLKKPVAEVRVVGLPERTGEGAMRTEIIHVGARIDDFIHLLRKDDGEVLRLPYAVGRVFLPRPEAVRSLELLDLPLRAIRGLSLDCGHEQRMSRAESGAWSLESPDLPLRVDLALANDFAEKLRQLRVLRWVGEADPSHHLDDPWCTIELSVVEPGREGEAPERLRLELGAETQGGYYARRGGEAGVFVVPRAVGLIASRWLLDRTPLMIDPAEITAARIEGRDGRSLDVRVSGGRWLAGSSGLGEQVRAALADLVAEGVVDLGDPAPGHGLSEPRLRVTLSRANADDVVLFVGSGEVWRDTNVFFVRKQGLDATFAVAQARLRPLLDAL